MIFFRSPEISIQIDSDDDSIPDPIIINASDGEDEPCQSMPQPNLDAEVINIAPCSVKSMEISDCVPCMSSSAPQPLMIAPLSSDDLGIFDQHFNQTDSDLVCNPLYRPDSPNADSELSIPAPIAVLNFIDHSHPATDSIVPNPFAEPPSKPFEIAPVESAEISSMPAVRSQDGFVCVKETDPITCSSPSKVSAGTMEQSAHRILSKDFGLKVRCVSSVL